MNIHTLLLSRSTSEMSKLAIQCILLPSLPFGSTYDKECALKKAVCKTKKTVSTAYYGRFLESIISSSPVHYNLMQLKSVLLFITVKNCVLF